MLVVQGYALDVRDSFGSVEPGWAVKSRKGEPATFQGVTRLPMEGKQAKVLIQWDSGSDRTYEYYAASFGLEITAMTHGQRETLVDLCARYRVEFNPEHYRVIPQSASMMAGWVEGWLGGDESTLYVGVDPDGRSHS